jgi:hypothetical protein
MLSASLNPIVKLCGIGFDQADLFHSFPYRRLPAEMDQLCARESLLEGLYKEWNICDQVYRRHIPLEPQPKRKGIVTYHNTSAS